MACRDDIVNLEPGELSKKKKGEKTFGKFYKVAVYCSHILIFLAVHFAF